MSRKIPRMPGWLDDRPPPSARDERPALALLREAEILEDGQHGDRERVVDHRDVDLLGTDARLAERLGPGPGRRRGGEVGAEGRVADGLAGAENPGRPGAQAGRNGPGHDHDRAAPVRDDAAL